MAGPSARPTKLERRSKSVPRSRGRSQTPKPERGEAAPAKAAAARGREKSSKRAASEPRSLPKGGGERSFRPSPRAGKGAESGENSNSKKRAASQPRALLQKRPFQAGGVSAKSKERADRMKAAREADRARRGKKDKGSKKKKKAKEEGGGNEDEPRVPLRARVNSGVRSFFSKKMRKSDSGDAGNETKATEAKATEANATGAPADDAGAAVEDLLDGITVVASDDGPGTSLDHDEDGRDWVELKQRETDAARRQGVRSKVSSSSRACDVYSLVISGYFDCAAFFLDCWCDNLMRIDRLYFFMVFMMTLIAPNFHVCAS